MVIYVYFACLGGVLSYRSSRKVTPFRFQFPLVLIFVVLFSAVFLSTASYALTDKEEKLMNLCKDYEKKFSSHARNYNMSLPLGANHVVFKYYIEPQLVNYNFEGIRKAIASILVENGMKRDVIEYVAIDEGKVYLPFVGSDFVGSYWQFGVKDIYVSGSPADSSSIRKFGGAVWDFFSSGVGIDQGAYVIIKRINALYQESHFVDCTECANILAQFLKEAIRILK